MKTQRHADRYCVHLTRVSRSIVVLMLGCLWMRAETGPPLWRFAHPNAKSLIGLNVGRIRQSGLLGTFERSWLESVAGHLPGLELLEQVDQVLISSPGSASAADPSEPPVLAMIRGRFDVARVRRLLVEHGAKPQMFDGVTVHRPQGKTGKEFAFAVLDAGTVLAGDAQSIFSSLERMGLATDEPTSAIVARAQNFRSDCDFWVVMTEPDALMSQRLPIGALAQSGLLQGVSGIELGTSLKNGLTLTGSLLTTSDQDAHALKDEFSKLLKLAAKEQAAKPEFAQFFKKLKLDVDGPAVKFSLRMPRLDLEASLRRLQTLRKTTESVLVEAAPVLLAKPQVIRIEGLDEGPREIRFPPPASQPR